jgi:manganese/zinc/iron transport system permease protein
MIQLNTENLLILLTAMLVAIPASVLGVYLMARKMVMVGDAISHAVLPGIVVAFLLTDSRDSLPMLIGAAIMGVLTTVFIDFLSSRLRIQQDAAIGTAFTFLFAVGVLLIAFYAGNNTDLDLDCVLYGELELSFLDQVISGKYLLGTTSILRLAPLTVIVLVFVAAAFRPLAIWAFNPEYGMLRGMRISGWQLAIMTLVSLHAVLSFESVGAIMVVGMLVLPAATARLISDKLKTIISISVAVGITGCLLGFIAGFYFNVSIAPAIVSTTGIFFTMIWAFRSAANRFTPKTDVRERN